MGLRVILTPDVHSRSELEDELESLKTGGYRLGNPGNKDLKTVEERSNPSGSPKTSSSSIVRH
jgi:hypothetical protein